MKGISKCGKKTRAFALRRARRSASGLAVLLACLAFAWPAAAATVKVINTADDGLGSLRWALNQANAGDSIEFDDGLDGQTITLLSPLPKGNKSLTFVVNGNRTVTVTSNAAFDSPLFDFQRNSGKLIGVVNEMLIAHHVREVQGVTAADVQGAGFKGDVSDFGGTVYGNKIIVSATDEAYGDSGGLLTGENAKFTHAIFENNLVDLTATGQNGEAFGSSGGLSAYSIDSFIGMDQGDGTLSARVLNNAVKATVSGGVGSMAEAAAGGIYTNEFKELLAQIDGNSATASATGGTALALGGGIFTNLSNSAMTIKAGTQITNNIASATGAKAEAQGGGIFINLAEYSDEDDIILPSSGTLNLATDRNAGAIVISGNKAIVNGQVKTSGIHFGRYCDGLNRDLIKEQAVTDGILNITGLGIMYMADPVTVDLDNNKSFTMTSNTESLYWGGENVLDAAGGSTVTLAGGTFIDGYVMDNGGLNGSQLVTMNLNGVFTQSGSNTTPSMTFNNTVLMFNEAHSRLDVSGSMTLGKNSVAVLDKADSRLVFYNGATMNLDLTDRTDPATAFIVVPDQGGKVALNGNVDLYAHIDPAASGELKDQYQFFSGDRQSAILDGVFVAKESATVSFSLTDTDDGIVMEDVTYVAPGSLNNNLTPNAVRLMSGFGDWLARQGTVPGSFAERFMQSYDSASLAAELTRVGADLTAESAVTQGLQAVGSTNAAAMAAQVYGLGVNGPLSQQSFVPMAFQAAFAGPSNALAYNGYSTSRRDHAKAKARYADRISSLDGNLGFASSTYSIFENWKPATQETLNMVREASPMSVPMSALGAAESSGRYGLRFWAGYLGHFAHQSKHGGYAGYDSSHNGFILGMSCDFLEYWTAGIFAGYTSGETDYNGVDADIDTDSTHAGAFLRFAKATGPGTFRATGDFIYSFMDNDSTRKVDLSAPLGQQTMTASYDQNLYGFGLELAYDWRPAFDEASVISPYLAGRYTHLDQDGYTENGNLPLRVSSTDYDSFTTSVGLAYARDFTHEKFVATPKVNVGWKHEWADSNLNASSNFVGSTVAFSTRSADQDEDALLLGAGLDLLLKQGQGWDIGFNASYGAEIRDHGYDQSVYGGLELRF